MLIVVAIVGIGIYARIVYHRHVYYRENAAMYKRFIAGEQQWIDIEKRRIAVLRDPLKGLNHEIESFEKLGKDPKGLKGEREYREACIKNTEEYMADAKRQIAEYETKHRRCLYLSSHPWLEKNPGSLDLK